MNGIENITEKIKSDALIEAQKIADRASSEADEILSRYEEKAKLERENILSTAQREAGNIMLRNDSQCGITARNHHLYAQREIINEAFKQGLVELQNIPEERYISWMAGKIRDAETAPAEIILNKKDKEAIGAKLIEKAKGEYPLCLSQEEGNFAGGFILKEGQIETNCTFEVLINSSKEDLEGEVATLLFE